MSKIPISLDEDFERELQNLKRNHDYTYMKITGLQPKQLDFAQYINLFCEANNQADFSVDGTSNSDSKDIVALENDINKPIFKMVAFNKIYVKLRDKYGEDAANSWLKSEYLGSSYLHDAYCSTFIPYCYAYDLTKLANEGLFFLGTHSSAPYNCKPANHLDTFVNHVKEFVSFCCNRQAGAVGLPNIILWMYYFWIKDIRDGHNGCKLLKDGKTGIEDYSKVDKKNQNIRYFMQCTQSLIYALNQPYLRNSIQSAFTNVSVFDHDYAHALFDGVVFPNGELALDHIDNFINTQKLFLETVSDIRSENMFTFPVLTISLLVEKEDRYVHKKDDTPATQEEIDAFLNKKNYSIYKKKVFKQFKDPKFAKWASDHNTKFFDSNFFIDDSVTSLSNCCRLKSDISDMMTDGYFNSVGGTALSVGSVKVCSINLANIAYSVITSDLNYTTTSGNFISNYVKATEKEFIIRLKKQAELNMKCLDVIRDIIIKNKTERHLLPNIADGLIDMKHMYNTIGVIGIYETIRAFQNKIDNIKTILGCSELTMYDYIRQDAFGNIFYTKQADDFVSRIFKEGIHDSIREFKKINKLDYNINCEQVPAETAASKLQQKDELSYPDIVIKDLPLYGNQFIPLGIKTTLEERVRVAAKYDEYLNGGSICHINYESTLNKDQAWEKLNWIADQGLTYSALTTKINVCSHNHAFLSDVCPNCGEKPKTQFARIVGFYVPVATYSSTRKQEFKLREWFND